jgi:hypothetical protein
VQVSPAAVEENRIVVAVRGDAIAAVSMGSSWTSPAQIHHFFRDRTIHPFFIKRKIVLKTSR